MLTILKVYIKVLSFIYLLKGRCTEIHFKDLKSNEYTEEYLYDNIQSVIKAYLSTIKDEIILKMVDDLENYLDD